MSIQETIQQSEIAERKQLKVLISILEARVISMRARLKELEEALHGRDGRI